MPADDAATVQEVHLALIHMLCDAVEEALTARRRGPRQPGGRRGPLVVIGDTLLDVDVEGDADRLCPDAPVPVVDVAAEHARPGGAGLAALLAARDGAEVVLITAIGDDPAGRRLCGLLSRELDLVRLPLRGGTCARPGSGPAARRCCAWTPATAPRPAHGPRRSGRPRRCAGAGAVLVADYGSGVAGGWRARCCRGRGAPIVWDPHPRGAPPPWPGARC